MHHTLELFDRYGPVLWRTSWQAGALALVVLAAMSAIGNRLAPRWRFLCWSLVVVRLLVPVLPETRFSLFNWVSALPEAPAAVSESTNGMDAVMPDAPAALPPSSGPEDIPVTPESPSFESAHDESNLDRPLAVERPASDAARAPIRWTVWKIAGVVWVVGSCIFSLGTGWQIIRLRRRSRYWRAVADPAFHEMSEIGRSLLGVRGPVRLLVTPDDCGPAVTGVIRPAVLLPERLLSDLSADELRMILLHELAHVRRRDVALQWLVVLARTVHWFNPAAWLAAVKLRTERELACDEAVLAALEPPVRLRYGEMLVRLAETAILLPPAAGILGTVGQLKSLTRRLEMIRDFRPRTRMAAAFACFLLAAMALFGLTNATTGGARARADDATTSVPSGREVDVETSESPSAPADDRLLAQADSKSNNTDDAKEGLREGWQWMVTVPPVEIGGKVYFRESRVRLWVEMGWLMVRRTTADGDFEWQVVLARASDPQRPEVKIDEKSGSLDIRYRGHFVRESPSGKFRIHREVKTAESPPWPLREDDGQLRSSGTGGDFAFAYFVRDDWQFVRLGRTLERPEFWLRFQPQSWPRRLVPKNSTTWPGFSGGQTMLGAPVELMSRNDMAQSKYDTIAIEEDLLVGTRVTPEQAAQSVSGKLLSDCLLSLDPPALDAQVWLNGAQPLAIGDLQGRVVLLDFWSVKSAPSVAQLARVEALQKKYASRGLVTIAIHPKDQSEKVAPLLKEKGVTLPVAIDAPARARGAGATGETAQRYHALGQPTYFLIDKTGKLDRGLGMEPPTESEIEALLLHDGTAPPLSAKEWINTPQPLALDKYDDHVVLLAFLDGSLLASSRSVNWTRQMMGMSALTEKFGPRGLVVIGVYRPLPNSSRNVPELLKERGVTFPVMVDTGETARSYQVQDFRGAWFLIGRNGRLRGGQRPSVPTESEVEELFK